MNDTTTTRKPVVIPGDKKTRRAPESEDPQQSPRKRSSRVVLTTLLILSLLVAGFYVFRPYISQRLPQNNSTIPGFSFFQHPDSSEPCPSPSAKTGESVPCSPSNVTFSRHAAPAGPAGPMIAFTPTQLASGIELDNPQRGPQYYGSEAPPPGWPLADRYNRWCWNEIEPQQGQYNFALIDQKLAQAAAAGYTFGFRIMPSNPGSNCLPDYLSGADYNSSQYMNAARNLINALARRYNNDPRLGWLDMSLYGCWGEWNESCGGGTMSAENRKALIDMQVNAFSNKGFFMLTSHRDSLDYALSLQRAKPIGVRIDCLGRANLGGGKDTLESDALARERWRVAPLYFEYCGGADFQQALADIKTYHASIIGDGANNINSFSSYSGQEQALLLENYRISGYRYVLNSLSISSSISAGGKFTVTTRWSNVNVAPTYNPWQVMIQLRDSAGRVVWQGQSSTDLRKVLPGPAQTFTDQFSLPGNIASGTYTVSLQILDANRYYRPLKLAIGGVQGDGSYRFGTVTVNQPA